MVKIYLTEKEKKQLKQFLAEEIGRGGSVYTDLLLKIDSAINV